jgi:hypothetical protein
MAGIKQKLKQNKHMELRAELKNKDGHILKVPIQKCHYWLQHTHLDALPKVCQGFVFQPKGSTSLSAAFPGFSKPEGTQHW